jgi:hypothetical protein
MESVVLYIKQILTLVKAAAEDFKGISYVRISSLPEAQRSGIALSFNSNLVIKILKEGEVLHDCLQYEHYLDWYENDYRVKPILQNRYKVEEKSPAKWAFASLTNLF